MTTRQKAAEGAGHTRYTYRLRVSSAARTALLAEWDRCRWVWNECVAKSRAVHAHNRAHPEDKLTCGPAQLDKMLTEARARTPWLREGASVPQQQTIRDFAKARAKALKDIDNRLPMRQRASMPKAKKKREALPMALHVQDLQRVRAPARRAVPEHTAQSPCLQAGEEVNSPYPPGASPASR